MEMAIKSPQESELLSAILEAAVDAIIISDGQGKILRANPAACRMFQYDADEMIGRNVKILMPEEMASQHDGFIGSYLDTGEKKIIGIGREVDGLRKDGARFPLHLSVGDALIEGEHAFIGIMHDLTQRKSTENALARSQRLDAIGQMTGGIAHDFNNLLTVVIGNLELLEMRGVNEKQGTLIKDALEAAELGADLTGRLMVFARKSNLNPVEVDLREICESTLAILKRTLGAPFRIVTDYHDNVRSVRVDPIQLQSALMNLALNARDAMGTRGEILISVGDVTIDDSYMAQEIDVEPGEYVRLSVSDDGNGMSPEAQRRAFEPFFTTKSETGGTGLGLATVYGFVRQSGGHVTLYSEPGLGTSFGLYFPALIQEETFKKDPSTSASEDVKRLPGSGETVMVVEDNPKVRAVSVARIQELGFHVVEAETGDEAYDTLKSGVRVHILFSDLVMPGKMNGYDLAAKVATEFPDLKILLTSGYASDVVADNMEHKQLYSVLHKPFRQAELSHRLRTLLAEN